MIKTDDLCSNCKYSAAYCINQAGGCSPRCSQYTRTTCKCLGVPDGAECLYYKPKEEAIKNDQV